MRKQSTQRCSAISLVRRAVRLKVVYADISGLVRVPTRLSEQRRYMTLGARTLALEECFSARSSLSIEASVRRFRSWNGKLIKLQRTELRCHQIVGVALIAKTCLGSNRVLIRVVETFIKKGSLSIQLKVADVSVPVGDCAPATAPSM